MFEPVRQHVSTACFLPFEAPQLAVVACCIWISWIDLCHRDGYRGTSKRGDIANGYGKAKHRTYIHRIRTPTATKQWKQKQQVNNSLALRKNQTKNRLPVMKRQTMKNVVLPNCESSNIPSNAAAIGPLSSLCALSWRWPCMAQRDPMP